MEKSENILEIFELFRRANRELRKQEPDAWMQLNLPTLQVKSLFFITNRGSTNFKNLAATLKVTPSNLTGVIDRLVEQGLVSRTENPEDRRMMVLKATEKGESLVSELRERRLSIMTKALNTLTPEELAEIKLGLTILAKAAENAL
ncbi:MAG TPA: MarR family transcriptional regulator [Dehalococcoidales bacterium]|nr:MarR family transcriptional regulator [Dehalococcoidales bacterium]